MKRLHVVPTLAIAAALLVPAAHSQQSNNQQSRTSQQQGQQQQGQQQLGQLQRVTEESVDRQFTASDFIGKAVYDQQGEKIGNIDDISLQQSVAKRFKEAAPGAESGSTYSAEVRIDEDEKEMELDTDKRRSQQQRQGRMSSGGETTVFISVGGLFGIGDDIVAAPASSLSYDQENDRFTMSQSKDQVVALAEQEATEYQSDDDRITISGSEEWEEESTMSARQQFSGDVSQIRDALRSDTELSVHASGIIVTTEDNKVHLRGAVESKEQKQRAEEIVKQNTDMDVKNSITVKKK